MQMIADGKLKDNTKIKYYDDVYLYEDIKEILTLNELLNIGFEMLEEDTTEEIEEIHYKERPDKTRGSINSLFDWVAEIETKTNELIRAYNKLNNTTYKAENCMTD